GLGGTAAVADAEAGMGDDLHLQARFRVIAAGGPAAGVAEAIAVALERRLVAGNRGQGGAVGAQPVARTAEAQPIDRAGIGVAPSLHHTTAPRGREGALADPEIAAEGAVGSDGELGRSGGLECQ